MNPFENLVAVERHDLPQGVTQFYFESENDGHTISVTWQVATDQIERYAFKTFNGDPWLAGKARTPTHEGSASAN